MLPQLVLAASTCTNRVGGRVGWVVGELRSVASQAAAVHFANGGRGVLVANVISINRLSGLGIALHWPVE